MITKEKILEILEHHAYRSAAAGRIVVYETNFEDIAEEVVKNCSIPDVVDSFEGCSVCGKQNPPIKGCSICRQETA